MATDKTSSISNVRHPSMDRKKGIGDVHTFDGIYEAIVTSTEDVQKNGRVRVRLVNSNANVNFVDENDSQNFLDIPVQWSSPFAGATNIKNLIPTGPGGKKDEEFEGTQKSYGMWMVPPDTGNRVLVMFINGDPAKGVIIGCMFQPLMNHMVPGIAKAKTFNDGDPLEVPVAEYNKASDEADNVDWKTVRDETGVTPTDNVKRPTHTPHHDGLKEQGLDKDAIRGLTSSSARRETPSKVFGILTPDANQFVMDDGDQQLIRLRTKSGAQILLDETNGSVYIINKKGSGFVEIDDAGKIDVWANDSISLRSHKDINLRADRDLNIESGRNINIRAHQTDDTVNIQPKTTRDLGSVKGNVHIESAGHFKVKADSGIDTSTNGTTNIYSAINHNLTALGVSNINAAGGHFETASVIHMNGPVAGLATPVGEIPVQLDDEGNLYFTDTLYERDEKQDRKTEKVGSILTRLPGREPFAREVVE